MKNKHVVRSHKSYYKRQVNRNWFFNYCNYQAWLKNRGKESVLLQSMSAAEPAAEVVEAEEVSD